MTAQPRILFLCRGSLHDGLGHVTRSRTVAQRLAGRAEVKFIVIGDGCAEPLLAGRALDFIADADVGTARVWFREFAPAIVVLDLLTLERDFCRAIAASALAVGLSPIFDGMEELALCFHRTAQLGPDWHFAPGRPELRAGLEYAVVSSHTTRIPELVFEHHASDPTLSIAISMGGTDAANKTLRVLERLKELPQRLLIWLLLGEGYGHSYQALVDTMRGSRHEIILAKTNDSMWRILHLCSLVVLAAGTTTYEAAFAGIPSINLLENGRSYFLIEELVAKGAALCAGHSFDESLGALNGLIAGLDADRPRLRAMHRAAQTLIDGQGADRIAAEILAFQAARTG